MEKQILHRWEKLLSVYDIDPLEANALYEDITSKYNEPSRAYHNLDHIEMMLSTSDVFEYSPELQFTIWFHDVIYNPWKENNEVKSAEYAKYELTELGIPNTIIQEVARLIVLTKTHNPEANDTLGHQLSDLDLAILGSEPDSYATYVVKIRKEYRMYPDWIYVPGRIKVLQSFLGRKKIYQTEEFKHLEIQARENITNEPTRGLKIL